MLANKLVTSTIASAAAIAPCIPDVSELAISAGVVIVTAFGVIAFAMVVDWLIDRFIHRGPEDTPDR